MPHADLVTSIEALLAAARSYNAEHSDGAVQRAQMLGMVESLHYQLEAPEEAMFRQLTNVSSTHSSVTGKEPC